MAIPTKEVEIDGVKFELRALPGREAYQLWLLIFKALGRGVENVNADQSLAEAAPRLIAGALSKLSSKSAERVRAAFAKSCSVEIEPGKRPTVESCFDVFFAGRPKLVSKWLFECLKLNFADFLDEDLLKNLLRTTGK